MPIYQSATFKGGPGQDYDYTRSGNPTRTHLERHLAKIMNANRALVVSSGMGACDVITRGSEAWGTKLLREMISMEAQIGCSNI